MNEETLAALAAQREAAGRILDTVADDVLASWARAWQQIDDEVRAQLGDGKTVTDRQKALQASQAQAKAAIYQASQDTARLSASAAETMARNAPEEQAALIASQLPPGAASFTQPPTKALNAIVARATEQITATAYLLSVQATAAVQDALRAGVAAGDHPTTVARAMLKNTAGPFNGGMARAQVIARTEILDAHRAAALETRTANHDVLAGWVWWAQLGDRTCISCIQQHGQLHDVDEPGPLDHHQGRCTAVPQTKTWKELGFDGGEEAQTVPPESGADWFDRQPVERQREIMGSKRFEAWQSGDFPEEAWSRRVSTDGWRDSYHVGAPTTKPPAATAAPSS